MNTPMNKLGQSPPKPRRARRNPSYPRCIAALALAAAMTAGCKDPEVAMAGDVAPAFEPDAATSTKTATPPPPAPSASEDSTEVMLGGEAPAPFEGDKQ